MEVYQRDDLQCLNCGRYRGMRGLSIDAHHIRPRQRGETYKMRNLVTACDRCHQQIHYGTVENPSHDNPLDTALEAVRGIGWQVQESVR
jgi:5-methylcytosine-specific restriction endonuclease McrA